MPRYEMIPCERKLILYMSVARPHDKTPASAQPLLVRVPATLRVLLRWAPTMVSGASAIEHGTVSCCAEALLVDKPLKG